MKWLGFDHVTGPSIGAPAIPNHRRSSGTFRDDEVIHSVFVDVKYGGRSLFRPGIGRRKVACFGREMFPNQARISLRRKRTAYQRDQQSASDSHKIRTSLYQPIPRDRNADVRIREKGMEQPGSNGAALPPLDRGSN